MQEDKNTPPAFFERVGTRYVSSTGEVILGSLGRHNVFAAPADFAHFSDIELGFLLAGFDLPECKVAAFALPYARSHPAPLALFRAMARKHGKGWNGWLKSTVRDLNRGRDVSD